MNSDRELEVGRAEAEAAALEASLHGEVQRLGAAVGEVQSRLAALRAAAAGAGGAAADIAGRLQRASVPQLKVDGWQEEALAARMNAVRARAKANDAIRQAVQGFSAELTKLSGQLAADEGALEAVHRRAQEEAKRAKAAKAAAAAAPVPPPLAPEDRTPTVPVPRAMAKEDPPKLKPQAPPLPGAARRGQPRVQMQAAIDLHSESNFFTGFSTNISDGGIFVATVAHVDIGTPIELSFSLPNGRKVDVHGVVRWTREVNDKTPDIFPGVGIQFQNLTDEAAVAIHDFVASREPMFYPE